MNTRRKFLITAPLGLAGLAASRALDAQAPPAPPPGAPPTFGTAPAAGPPVSPSTFAEAEKLVQVEMTAGEREMAVSSWQTSMAPLLERRVGPRRIALDASL